MCVCRVKVGGITHDLYVCVCVGFKDMKMDSQTSCNIPPSHNTITYTISVTTLTHHYHLSYHPNTFYLSAPPSDGIFSMISVAVLSLA